MIQIVEGIATTMGKNCEVVLHDISNPKNSIVAIANGHITGRSIGGPMSEYGLATLRKGVFDSPKANYLKKTPDGRVLKSTTSFIKDGAGSVIGFLCINVDISELTMMKNILTDFLTVDETIGGGDKDTFGDSINDVLSTIVNRVLEEFGRPVNFMSKEDKVNLVENLDQKGIFLVKGAVDYVAKVLCVSRYTIYNYLDEIRIGD